MSKLTFEEWLQQLDDYAAKEGYPSKKRLSEDTGPECWRDHYESGDTPAESFQEDMSYGGY